MNFRTTLIIFVVFALFGGVYLLFLQPGPDAEKSDGLREKISETYHLNKDSIRQMRLSFKDESYRPLTLTKSADSGWQLTAPITVDADSAKVNEMLNDLLNKRVKKTIEVTTLSQYGLDPPTIRVELWTESENPAKTFLIGDKTINYSVYTKEESEPQVILIESSALDDLTKSASDLRDRTVLKFAPEQVSELTLRVAGQAEIRCQKHDERQWKLIQPVQAKADAKEIESILTALNTLKVATFEADGESNLAKYGLEAPRLRINLKQAQNSSQTLLIGRDTDTTDRVYASSSVDQVPSGAYAIYALNKDIHTTLHKTVFDLRDKRVIDFQRTSTNRFEIQQGGQKIVCETDNGTDWKIKEPVALEADPAAVDNLLFGVDALKAVAFVSDRPKSLQPYGLDRPSIKVSFMTSDAEPTVFLVGNQKGDNVYVKAQNAEPVSLVKKGILDLVGMGVAGLRHKQVLNFSIDDPVRLTLIHGKVNLTCQRQGINWRLTHPVKENAKNDEVNSIMYEVNGLTVTKFFATSPPPARTGLDAPDIQLSIVLKSQKEYALQIGKSHESNGYYARLRNAPDTVFLLKSDLPDKLKKTVKDLRSDSGNGDL